MNSEYNNIRRIAVISDTHGHLPGELIAALKNVDLIIHAGDIDRLDILDALKALAPVLAVQGNMDRGDWAHDIPAMELASIEGILIYVLHDLLKLDIEPESIGVKMVISGHTHRPMVEKKGAVLYVNPGSVSLPRGGFKPSFAVIALNDHQLDVQIKDL